MVAELPSGKVLIAGGRNSSNQDLSTTEILDFSVSPATVTAGPSMTNANTAGKAVRVGSLVLVAGGYPNYDRSEVFNESAGSSGAWQHAELMNGQHGAFLSLVSLGSSALAIGGAIDRPLSEIYYP